MTLLQPTVDPTPTGRTPHVTVLADRCAGCQECVIRCPTGALTMDLTSWTALADDARCVGCRQCVRTCPFSAIEVEGPLVVAPRAEQPHHQVADLAGNLDETRQGIATWTAVLAETERCLACPDPTCVRGCPVHNDIPSFIAAVRGGDLDEAHRVLRRTSFLPDICARVCDQAVQCEGACTWSLAGGTPVAIGAIERFITDNAPVPAIESEHGRGSGLSVAVVGSGPAGIGAAFELVRAGAEVTVFDKDERPGGLLRWGIPSFTLPRQVAERPWEQLASAGVRFVGASEITPERVEELRQSYDAVILAHGAGKALRLPVEGGDLGGVVDATQFLNEARTALTRSHPCSLLAQTDDRRAGEPARVLVLGAGNTAMDVARLARRLGAWAICVDWMDRRFAPVRPDELEEATEEGVDIRFCTTLTRLEGSAGQVERAVLAETRQVSATKTPKVTGGEVTEEQVDLVVMAMGYRIDPAFAGVAPGKPITRRIPELVDRRFQASGLLAAGAPRFARHRPIAELSLAREIGRLSAALGTADRVFVAGDALVGPSTVVEAMAQGRRAAEAILDRQPHARPTGHPDKVATILVAFESRGGHTEALAHELAQGFARSGARVSTRRLCDIGLAEIATADLVVLGTWVEGFVVAGVGPARAARATINGFPGLGATKLATFCSYGVAPGATLAKLRRMLEAKGGHVVAEHAFGPRDRSGSAPTKFASEVLAVLVPAPRVDEVMEVAVSVGEDYSASEATHQIAQFAGGREVLLTQARQRLADQLQGAPGTAQHRRSARRPRDAGRASGERDQRGAARGSCRSPTCGVGAVAGPGRTGVSSRDHDSEEVAMSEQVTAARSGDLARRIAHRREELGLTHEEVARRAGMDVGYLDYFEHNPAAALSSGTWLRLARALETTPASLAGGDVGRPPGPGRAGPHPVLETLTREQCEEHLGAGGVGRVVFVVPRGPVALPVNFRFHADCVVFRTAATASVTGAVGAVVGFEVDRIDEATSEGWSVLVTGQAERAEAGERAALTRLGIEPWAGGYRDVFVRIRVDEISGRAIRQGR